MNTKTNIQNTKVLLRDSKGKFVSTNSNKAVSTKTNTKNTKVILRDSQGHFVGSNSKKAVSATGIHSSFIKSLKIDGPNVNVVLNKNTKTVYTYKPTTQGLNEVKKVLTQGGSIGEVYNKFLKGNEISRTIYAK